MWDLDATNRAALDRIFARAAGDRGFRQRLLAEPRKAIAEVTGISLPRRTRIKFVERDPRYDVMFVLPDPVDPEAELTTEELEAVAGGQKPWCTCASSQCGGSGPCGNTG